MKSLLVSITLMASMAIGAAVSDAEKNNSTAMNATAVEGASKNEGGVRVVFIGNSITLHGAMPSIGWNHVWGMAASAEEKDYVHLVAKGIEAKTGRKVDFRVRNLAMFERDFVKYDLNHEQDLVDFKPDYVIFALGENVPALNTVPEQEAYREAFKSLIGRFQRAEKSPVIIVRGVFWPNAWKDAMMEQAAKAQGVKFVKADIGNDNSNKAIGLFEHSGVASHPGDKGMAGIAKLILDGIFGR